MLVEAQFEDGVLRPSEQLGFRSGERVNIIVVRRPDPGRWDLAKLAKAGSEDDLALAEQGGAEWASTLDGEDRGRSAAGNAGAPIDSGSSAHYQP